MDQEYDLAMRRLQAFKYELMPDGQQERQMRHLNQGWFEFRRQRDD